MGQEPVLLSFSLSAFSSQEMVRLLIAIFLVEVCTNRDVRAVVHDLSFGMAMTTVWHDLVLRTM